MLCCSVDRCDPWCTQLLNKFCTCHYLVDQALSLSLSYHTYYTSMYCQSIFRDLSGFFWPHPHHSVIPYNGELVLSTQGVIERDLTHKGKCCHCCPVPQGSFCSVENSENRNKVKYSAVQREGDTDPPLCDAHSSSCVNELPLCWSVLKQESYSSVVLKQTLYSDFLSWGKNENCATNFLWVTAPWYFAFSFNCYNKCCFLSSEDRRVK